MELIDITKSYQTPDKNRLSVLSSISFQVEKGDVISIYGPNGSGKSTLLNIIAKVIKPDNGNIKYDCDNCKIGYVWQNFAEALFPWFSVKKNIELPLIINENTFDNRIDEIFELLGFDFSFDKFPYQLSGGQQQMVSIARAIINNPEIIILDEPFSALDKKKREQALLGLHEYFKKYNPIVFFVSHSLDEAILFSNKLLLLSEIPGKIIGNLDIVFKKKRNANLLTTDEFILYRNQALEIINR